MRLSDTNKHCSSCFGSPLNEEFVDFEADWDGPLIARQTDMGVELPPHSIDDLNICAICLREAARLIGMSNEADATRLAEVEAELVELRLARIEAERRLTAIQKALQGRPSPAPGKGPGRPKKASA